MSTAHACHDFLLQPNLQNNAIVGEFVAVSLPEGKKKKCFAAEIFCSGFVVNTVIVRLFINIFYFYIISLIN